MVHPRQQGPANIADGDAFWAFAFNPVDPLQGLMRPHRYAQDPFLFEDEPLFTHLRRFRGRGRQAKEKRKQCQKNRNGHVSTVIMGRDFAARA